MGTRICGCSGRSTGDGVRLETGVWRGLSCRPEL